MWKHQYKADILNYQNDTLWNYNYKNIKTNKKLNSIASLAPMTENFAETIKSLVGLFWWSTECEAADIRPTLSYSKQTELDAIKIKLTLATVAQMVERVVQ